MLDSQLVDKLVDRLLDSDEIQKLIKRIAEAPEIRTALTSQGVGLLEDLGRQVRGIAHRLDGAAERVARRLVRKPQRTEPTDNAGLVTRGLGLVIDAAIINGAFFVTSAVFAFAASALFPDSDITPARTLVLGATTWLVILSGYLLFFWTLAGQTPGMRLLGIRLIDAGGAPRLSPATAIRRLVWTVLALIPFGLGFLAVLVSDRRRALQDRRANTEVILVDRDGRPESASRRAAIQPARWFLRSASDRLRIVETDATRLQRCRPWINRRQALAGIGSVSLGALLAACGSDDDATQHQRRDQRGRRRRPSSRGAARTWPTCSTTAPPAR